MRTKLLFWFCVTFAILDAILFMATIKLIFMLAAICNLIGAALYYNKLSKANDRPK